ncbi:hypothetical protein BGX20_007166 [Mortierella sp. AD010]|nr:hypothetical protein BGX20_007166 [Mortierella sp. AD010]
MRDAVVLANCIYNLRDKTDDIIRAAFASYYRQCHLEANEVVKGSAFLTSVVSGHAWSDRLMRKVYFTGLKFSLIGLFRRGSTNSLQIGPKLTGYHWLRTTAQERFSHKKEGKKLKRKLIQSKKENIIS